MKTNSPRNFQSLAKWASFVSVLIVIFCGLVAVRFPAIFERSGMQILLEVSWTFAGITGWSILFRQKPSLAVWALAVPAALLIHSYANLFWPSLRRGIPELDYVFYDNVSSNYCFVLAKKYMSNLFFPFSSFAGYILLHWEQRQRAFHIILAMLLLSLLSNLIVVGFQGWLDINILAQGSGTAITANRTPGLLEDSGASTVVLSGLLTLFWILIFDLHVSWWTKLLLSVLWLLCAYIGLFSGGRSYLSLLCLGLFAHGIWQSRRWPVLVRAAWTLCLACVVGFAAWELKDKLAFGTLDAQAFQNQPLHIRIAGWLDPIRGLHSAILWKSIIEYWPQGLGLGGSHIAIAQHMTDFSSTGIPIAPDAPLNYYFGLILEAGLGGVFMLLSVGMLYCKCLLSVWGNPIENRILKPLLLLFGCLCISGLVGTQVLLRSYSTLISFTLSFMTVFYINTSAFHQRWKLAESFLALGIISLLGVALVKYNSPPMVPEFFWDKQGKPQLPLGYNVPIATPEKSQWMAPNVPFAVQGEEIKFFVELPSQYYPLRIQASIFESIGHRILQTKQFPSIEYDATLPGKTLSVQLHQQVAQYCSTRFSAADYCYAKISMDPIWKISSNIVVGYSLMTTKAHQ